MEMRKCRLHEWDNESKKYLNIEPRRSKRLHVPWLGVETHALLFIFCKEVKACACVVTKLLQEGVVNMVYEA
jgi:hypothetical protein